MEAKVQNLINILEYELERYSALLNILNKERNALIQMRIDDVHMFNSKKEQVLFDIETSEIKRNRIVTFISKEQNIPAEEMSISRLATVIPKKFIITLEKLQLELNKVISDIAEANTVNGMLIEKTDKFLSKCINLINTICTPVSVYMPSGEVNKYETMNVGSLLCEKG